VPEDVSVAGFDDCALASLCKPAVTTYAVDIEGMAFACVNNLIKKIVNRQNTDHIMAVDGKLVVRGSVAPCPAEGRETDKAAIG
jgi:LacI family transcriptional regulator